MQVISSRTFRESQKKYLDLALQERVIIKRKNVYLELVPRGDTIPENPSPSLDPWFDNPKNIELLNQSIGQVEKGQTITLSKELQQKL
jgi:hypothetical protein